MARRPADTKRLADRVRRLQVDDKRRRSQPATTAELREMLEFSWEAVGQAKAVRERYRRQVEPANAERLAAVNAASARLHEAAARTRPELARLPRDPDRDRIWGERLRAAAHAVQTERRKLWKMLPHA